MNKRELFNSFVKSYAALVEDMENTIDCLGKKQVLTDLINGAKRFELWDIWYWLSEAGYYTEDKRKIRDFALNVINNCYEDHPSSVYEERINHEIENAIFNALHKDKEEYFQGLDEALELHDVLNPVLWENEVLRSDVASALLKIANTFVDGLGFPLNVVDIRIVGSNASYNYNKDSDIDLHIITNFELNYVDDIILQQLYNNEKNSFNNKHDIKVKGIPVELYVEDIRSMNVTNGSYSLLDNSWIKFPQPMNYTIPDYSMELEEELDRAEEALLSDSSQKIKEEINHVYLMRRDGLASEGEVSKGNLIFKELRNMGILKTLAEKFYELESIELSLESEDLTEYHDYLNLAPQIGFDDSDRASVDYWKEQIKKGNHRPILINTDKEILDGNHTMVAYQELEIEPPYVYLGTREDFYKHVANTKPIDALVAVKDMVADGSAELLEDLKSYPISSDVVKNILDDLFTNFGWHSIYGDNKKKLIVLSKNNKKVGTVNISNHKRQVHFHILGGSITVDIPDSYDNNDSEYDYMIRSFDRTLSSLIKDIRSEKKSSEEKDDIDFGFTGHQEDEDGNVYSYQNGVKGEVALDDYFDESQVISEDDLGYEGVDVRDIPQYDNTEHGSVIYDLKEFIKGNTLNEADLLDILNKARSETPKRIRRSQSLYSEYTGLDSDGTIMFHTDSQTRAGHNGHDQFIFYEGFFDLLDKVDAGEHISQEDVLDIITGDVMIRCTCEDFLYGGFAYMSWNNGYGLQKELRAPDVRNPNREGSACKHCLSVLNLINQSNTLFDTIAKDLDALFQRYKKMAKNKAKNESQILTEISDLHGDLDPYDLADNLFRLAADIEVLYDKYDKDNSGVKDKDSIIASLDDIRDFVVNKFGMMGDTTNMVTEAVGDVTPDGVMDTLDSIYKEIDDLYDQEKSVVGDTTKDEHLKAIKKIQAFFTKKFDESKKS